MPPITLDGTRGITTPTYNGSTTAEYLVPVTGFKNRIINGDMTIDQRNAGAQITPSVQYTLDRWIFVPTQASKFTLQQNAGSVTPPAGFTNYLGITSTSSYSVLSSDTFFFAQFIEGFNTADLDFGKSTAKTVTLSFWVRSSLTGTFGGAFLNSAANRSYPFSYTISAANTWEQKSITVAGDTTGTWVGATNGIGLQIRFGLGSGSTYTGTAGAWVAGDLVQSTGNTSVVGTNGATFYITGVQLEVGSNATSFDYLPYGTELALCQRYFQRTDAMTVQAGNATSATGTLQYATVMRANPTFSLTSAFKISDQAVADFTQSSANISIGGGNRVSTAGSCLNFGNFTGLTQFRPYSSLPNETGFILLSSEL